MAILYILASITVLAVHWDQLLPTLALVFKSAFTPAAAVGGFAGATVQQAIQRGIARGFSQMNLVWVRRLLLQRLPSLIIQLNRA